MGSKKIDADNRAASEELPVVAPAPVSRNVGGDMGVRKEEEKQSEENETITTDGIAGTIEPMPMTALRRENGRHATQGPGAFASQTGSATDLVRRYPVQYRGSANSDVENNGTNERLVQARQVEETDILQAKEVDAQELERKVLERQKKNKRYILLGA